METPTLTAMGINNPSEITRYTLSQPSALVDELTVYYKRQKGSLLPVRRAYEFGRALRSAVADSGTGRIANVGDISPRLLEAIAELDKLLARKESSEGRKEAILDQLSGLRKTLATRGNDAELEKQLNEIEAGLREM
jgi:Protein of unknown function (DUF3461)